MVVASEPMEGLRVLKVYGNPQTAVIGNTRPIYPVDVTSGHGKYRENEEIRKSLQSLSRQVSYIPVTEKAMQMGSPILGSMIIMEALLERKLLPLRAAEFRDTLSKNFNVKSLEINL